MLGVRESVVEQQKVGADSIGEASLEEPAASRKSLPPDVMAEASMTMSSKADSVQEGSTGTRSAHGFTAANNVLSRFSKVGRPGASSGALGVGACIRITQNLCELDDCEAMLIFLNNKTWTNGASLPKTNPRSTRVGNRRRVHAARRRASAQISLFPAGKSSDVFGAEIAHAMSNGVSLTLAHEMPGIGGQEARGGTPFSSFFAACATPIELLKAGIYSKLAIPFKGGAWREASSENAPRRILGIDAWHPLVLCFAAHIPS